jgi:hypothetical protein
MTHQPEANDKTTPAAPQADTAVREALAKDLGNQFFPGAAKPEAVGKLVQDGILPAGSTVIDMGKVQEKLTADTKTAADLKGQQPADTKDATKGVADATGVQKDAGTKLDAAQGKVDGVQGPIDARNKLDADVKKDFDTLHAATKKDEFNKDDLTKLAADTKQTPEVRAAAAQLVSTFHDKATGKNGSQHKETDDYGKNVHWFKDASHQYINKDTIADGVKNHQTQNTEDQKKLDPLVKDRDAAKQVKDKADTDVTTAQKGLDTLNTQNKDLADQKTQTDARIKEEQGALTPDASLDKASRVVKGGGYYQVAENMLGISDKGGHSAMQEKELKMLTQLLQNEEKQLNGGHLPKYLKQNDQLLKPENLQHVLDSLQHTPADTPAPKKAVLPAPDSPPPPRKVVVPPPAPGKLPPSELA